jgi:hypothetical protein
MDPFFQLFPVQVRYPWPMRVTCIVAEYLVATRMQVNYVSHELSQFSTMGEADGCTIPGWTSFEKSFKNTCRRLGRKMEHYRLKDKTGTIVSLDTIWNDLELGAECVQLIVCLRK